MGYRQLLGLSIFENLSEKFLLLGRGWGEGFSKERDNFVCVVFFVFGLLLFFFFNSTFIPEK